MYLGQYVNFIFKKLVNIKKFKSKSRIKKNEFKYFIIRITNKFNQF